VLDHGDDAADRWASLATRRAEAEEINRRIASALTKIDRADALRMLLAHDIPALELVEPNELAAIAHFRSRGLFDPDTEPPLARFPIPLDGMRSGQ